MYKILKH